MSLPSRSFKYGGPQPRVSSPTPGRSIFMTSAPKSASICPHQGPATTRLMSSTRRCDRAPPDWLDEAVVELELSVCILLLSLGVGGMSGAN